MKISVYGETALHVLSTARPVSGLDLGRVALTVGGPAGVVAMQLARLGHAPRLVSAIGDDDAGRLVRAKLEESGVDCSAVTTSARTTRVVAVVAGDSVALAADPGTGGVPGSDRLPMPASTLSYASGFPALRPVIETLAAHGHRLVVDVGFIPLLRRPAELLAHVGAIAQAIDVAVISGAELSASHRTALSDLCLEAGARATLTTLGGAGVIVATPDQWRSLPAVPAEAVDTLCAGDSFAGGFLAAQAEGQDVFTAAEFGQRVAARKVAGFGIIPTREQVLNGSTCDSNMND